MQIRCAGYGGRFRIGRRAEAAPSTGQGVGGAYMAMFAMCASEGSVGRLSHTSQKARCMRHPTLGAGRRSRVRHGNENSQNEPGMSAGINEIENRGGEDEGQRGLAAPSEACM